jgi:hypothetical protein
MFFCGRTADEIRRSRLNPTISVLKRRSGVHATDIRELILQPRIAVGEQLSDLQGVFTGVPRFEREQPAAGTADHC